MEEEEIDDGHHDLDDGDEGCSENWTPLMDAPGHYQEACCRRHDSLIIPIYIIYEYYSIYIYIAYSTP